MVECGSTIVCYNNNNNCNISPSTAPSAATTSINTLDTLTGPPKMAKVNYLGTTIEEKTRKILGWTDGFQPTLMPNNGRRRHSNNSLKMTYYPTTSGNQRFFNGCAPYGPPINAGSKVHRCKSVSGMPLGNVDSMPFCQLTPPPSPVVTQNTVTISSLPIQSSPVSGNLPPPPPYSACNNGISFKEDRTSQFVAPSTNCLPSSISPSGQSGYVSSESCGRLPRRVTAKEAFEKLKEMVPSLNNSETNKYRTLIQTVSHVIELEGRLAQLKEETKELNDILNYRMAAGPPVGSSMSSSLSDPCLLTVSSPSQMALPCASGVSVTSNTTVSQVNGSNGASNGEKTVPDDLLNIDVTAFKFMVASPTGSHDSSTCSVGSPDPSQQLPVESLTQWVQRGDPTLTSIGTMDDNMMDMPSACASSIEALSIDTAAVQAW